MAFRDRSALRGAALSLLLSAGPGWCAKAVLPGAAAPGRPPPATEQIIAPDDLNAAGLEILILPDSSVPVGTELAFHVATRKAGYLVLLDVNAEGAVTQIYPNVFSMKLATRPQSVDADACKSGLANTLSTYGLAAGGDVKSNLIEPGRPFDLPGNAAGTAYAFQVCPPAGHGMVVAILSDRPVQVIDLPDLPSVYVGQPAGFDRIVENLRALRLVSTDETGDSRPPQWSVVSKGYTIR